MTGFELSMTGLEGLARLDRDLKAAGQKLPRSFYKGLNASTKELRLAIKRSYLESLPHHGGLNKRAASASITTRGRVSGASMGIRIRVAGRGGKPVDVDRLDAGVVQHKTFGHTPSVQERVEPDSFQRPWDKHADVARKELLKVIDETLRSVRL